MASWCPDLGFVVPLTEEQQQQRRQQQQTANADSSSSSSSSLLPLSSLLPSGNDNNRGLAAAFIASFGSILPPLPLQGPSPHGRSSSPRHHSSMSTPIGTTTTASMPRNGPSTPNRPSTPPRRRSFIPPLWSNEGLLHAEPSNLWGDDTVSDNLPLVPSADSVQGSHLFTDDQLMSAIVGGDFSSPSTYPSFVNQSSPRSSGLNLSQASRRQLFPAPQVSMSAPDTAAPSTPSLRRIHSSAYSRNTLATSSRTNTQLTNSSLDTDSQHTSQNTNLPNDILNEDLFSATPDTSFSDTMSMASRRTNRATPAPASQDASTSNKRRRTARSSQLRPSSRQSNAALVNGTGQLNEPSLFYDTDEDLFGDSPTKAETDVYLKAEEYATIDLTEATEVPEELKKPEVDNRIKLSAFQCVICMDDATTLTVTHCGHLYCAQCLHSSLNVDATRGKCPMCRTKIDMKQRGSYTTKTKGFWPLELKLMTATRKGKRKVEDLS
ncbi:E3 ubiquitin-protein ligase complex slx8-rfp subunit slx8 [Cladobotryum mycophilum]|uniref:E3 ubiquitin-protein ligase complex slx8-rfp subunit slx8 n=1 Tax=Cladobotryum mycophilum TaxID=491253 RepID=A0ABR0SBJ1_9HYPO